MRASRARATVRVHGPYGGSGPTLPNGLTRPGRPRAPAHHPIPVHLIDGSGLRDTRRSRVEAAIPAAHLEDRDAPDAGAVPRLRAVPLLPHGPHLAEDRPRAVRPAFGAAPDPPGRHLRALREAPLGDRLPDLDQEQPDGHGAGDGA